MTDLRTDDDLEQLLRGTLATAADTISSGPSWNRADADEILPAAPRRAWLSPVAAAAAAAVVAGIIVANQPSRDDRTPPASSLPTNSRSASPAPSKAVDVRRAACTVPLPPSWSSAARRALASTPATSDTALAVLPDGESVVARDTVAKNRIVKRVIAYVEADGASRSMYTVPAPSDGQMISAQVEGSTVLVQIGYDYSSGGRVVELASRIVVIDPGLGVVNVAVVPGVASRHPARYIDGAAMLNGHVYYDVRTQASSDQGRVHDFDLDRFPDKPESVVFTGAVAAPRLLGSGVTWAAHSDAIAVPRPVPAPVATETAARTGDRSPAVTDGDSWAWKDNDESIAWYRHGQRGPVHVRLGHDSDVLAVAGDYVIFAWKTGTYATDMRTGATATLLGIGAPPSLDGVVLLSGYARNDRPVVIRLDTKALPGLTC